MTTNNFIAVFIGKTGGDFFRQLQNYNLSNINYLALDFDQEENFSADIDIIKISQDSKPEDYTQQLRNYLAGNSILFLFASTENLCEMSFGMSISKLAHEMGILNIAAVLSYMGYDDEESAEKVKKFKSITDAFILLSYCESEKDDYNGLFYEGICDRICRAVQGINYLFTKTGLKPINFDELKNFLAKIGAIECSTSQNKGIALAALRAIDSIRGYEYKQVFINIIPALEYFYDGGALSRYSFSEAERVLIIIATGQNFTLKNLYRAVQIVESRANPKECNPALKILWSHVFDERLKDSEVRVTLISSFGFEAPSGNYYENYEYMFKNEPPEKICEFIKKNLISIYDKDKEFGIRFIEAVIRYGTAELLNLCFDSGLRYDSEGIKNFVDYDDIRCVTPFEPLESAIEYNNLETLKILLKHGIIRDKHSGKSALIIAASQENFYIAKYLINQGFNVNACDKDGKTALIWAAGRVDLNITRELVRAGANINFQDDNGNTALMTIGANYWRNDSKNGLEIAKILINNGADVNILNFRGENALICLLENFSYNQHVDDKIINFLVDSGVNINHVSNNGNSALSLAIENNFALVPVLLSAGADLKILTFNSFSLFDEDANFLSKKLYRRCERFGLVPFDNLYEALNNNSEENFSEAVKNGLFGDIGYIDGFWVTHRDALPVIIKIRYNALKNGSKEFLTREYARTNIYIINIIIGMIHLAISDYDVELLKILLESASGYISDVILIGGTFFINNQSQKRSYVYTLRTNYFPECESSDEAREFAKKLKSGAEILRLLKDSGFEKILTHSKIRNDELTYTFNSNGQILNYSLDNDAIILARAVSPEALKSVIDSGVNVNHKFRNFYYKEEGITALEIIANDYKNYFMPDQMIKILLDYGADISALSHTWIRDYLIYENQRAKLDMTQIKILELIMSSGKIDNIICGEKEIFCSYSYSNRRINLHMRRNLWEVIEDAFMIQKLDLDSKVDANLIAAACYGNIRDLREFLSLGADINTVTKDGYTPLMYAAIFNTPETVKFLIDNGADIKAKNFQRQTVLQLIISSECRPSHPGVIHELVKAGADVNYLYDGESTLLMIAACECCYDDQGQIAAELIKSGADINFTRHDGETALTLAYKAKNFGTVRVLLAAGADISAIL